MTTATRPPKTSLYSPSASEPEIVEVPAMKFLMVDGEGNPNTSPDYAHTIEALYSVAYGLKFLLKKRLGNEFKVAPLEGLWWAPDMKVFSLGHKDGWRWTMMIAQPEEVTPDVFEEVRGQTRQKKPSVALERMRLERFNEGLAAQVMHIGPYAAEGPTITRLHEFIRKHGYRFDGTRQKHHEIYLGDPRRAAPDKLRTVIRQPMKAA